tara:strand:- start:55 stop:837 length:783 start_codon:yes stop_codon:yes gene_type:complete
MLSKLIKLADNLDMLDLNIHANIIDCFIKKISSKKFEPSYSHLSDSDFKALVQYIYENKLDDSLREGKTWDPYDADIEYIRRSISKISEPGDYDYDEELDSAGQLEFGSIVNRYSEKEKEMMDEIASIIISFMPESDNAEKIEIPLSDDEKIVNFIEDVFNPNFEVDGLTSLIDAYHDKESLSEYVLHIFPDKIVDLWCSIDNKDGFDANIKSIDGESWYFLDEILDEARGHAFAREKEIIDIIGILRRELASYNFDISC